MSDLTKAGDQLQSCASRMAEWILNPDKRGISKSYEVQMAALEAQSAVDEWTVARVANTRAPTEQPPAPPVQTKSSSLEAQS